MDYYKVNLRLISLNITDLMNMVRVLQPHKGPVGGVIKYCHIFLSRKPECYYLFCGTKDTF